MRAPERIGWGVNRRRPSDVVLAPISRYRYRSAQPALQFAVCSSSVLSNPPERWACVHRPTMDRDQGERCVVDARRAAVAEIKAMGRLSFSGSARSQRRVIGVLGVIPNAPTHRRDTIECALECGHARSVLRINRGEAPIAGQCRDLIGAELQCAKCAVLERIRRKARVRANRRRLSRWATLGSGSSAAG
jgi:hypothetical protein